MKKSDVREMMEHIVPMIASSSHSQKSKRGVDEGFSYIQQRAMINQIFQTTSNESYNEPSVMLRLVVIDSLYSTNAAYSYFSFEDMAESILSLGNEREAADYFYIIAIGGKDGKGLFSASYGIRKNLEEGSKQMSLMSKYAYYALLQQREEYPLGFPIYDSLAIEMYPKLYKNLKGGKYGNLQQIKESIENYIEALDELRVDIFDDNALFGGYQQYDMLDAYLWRMGKINGGNYSLLFDKRAYIQFIENIGLSYRDNNQCSAKSAKFNELVRARCAEMSSLLILQEIEEAEGMRRAIEHWKNYYIK